MKSNFIGRSNEYHSKTRRIGCVVPILKHAARWPISLDTPNIHLACYFREVDYASSEGKRNHRGIDIQTKIGTSIITPSRGRVVMHRNDYEKGLKDVAIYSDVTKILYVFMHLDTTDANLPKPSQLVNFDSDFYVKAHQHVGTIGRWPEELSELVDVPKDVELVHGRKFDHLHFETHFYRKMPDNLIFSTLKKQFNPLGLLVKL